MITPAYSPTATERVLPRMALDFTTGVLDPRVTIARALNTATRVNSSGLIEIVNANLPRFDYNPATLAPKGLLIEESRTNAIVYSQDFSNILWVATASTKTSTNNPDPAGTSTALLITANGASTAHYLIGGTAISYTSGTTYTASAYIQAGSTSFAQITLPTSAFGAGQYANFQLTGSGSVTASAGGTASIAPAGNGWYRVSFSVAATATVLTSGFFLVFIANGTAGRLSSNTSTDTLYFWGAQIETGAFATSYIPTTTTSLTRNADAVYMTGTNLTDWYNATEGALLVQATTSEVPTTDANVRYAAILYETATFANAIRLERLSGNYRGVKTVAGSSLVASAAWANNLTAKAIFAYKNANSATSFNAGNPGLYAGGVPSGIAYLGIGGTHQGANVWCGHVQRISYWPQRVTNAETQAFSK